MICIPFVKLTQRWDLYITQTQIRDSGSVGTLKCYATLHFDHVGIAKNNYDMSCLIFFYNKFQNTICLCIEICHMHGKNKR